jgi:hypothetical protein
LKGTQVQQVSHEQLAKVHEILGEEFLERKPPGWIDIYEATKVKVLANEIVVSEVSNSPECSTKIV